MTKRERCLRAKECHEKGLNCGQSVLLAFTDVTGLTEAQSMAVASGFGGGLRYGGACGVVNAAAVVLGMVYNYLPFMILPIYSVICKLDHSLLEAARDLGANTLTVFRKVILPLSLPGVLSGITMVFVPSVSTFAISRMLGGGTELLLGDLIERQFLGGAYNPQLGAAISLVMMLIVVVCMLVMNRFGEGEEQAVML